MTDAEIYTTFAVGTRVRVRRCKSYKKYDYTGTVGTVLQCAYGKYGKIVVELDGVQNPYSGASWFYFKPYELEVVTVGEIFNDIQEEEINVENVANYLNIAVIEFVDERNSCKYNYANFEPELKKGDLCVVKSAHHGLGLAKVVEIVERRDIQTPREVVARVDTQDYDCRVAVRKDAAELKAKMKERARQLQDIALYRVLAETDPDMKELLTKYQALDLV